MNARGIGQKVPHAGPAVWKAKIGTVFMKDILGSGAVAMRFGFAMILGLSVALAAPGSIPAAQAEDTAADSENDPLEPMNRGIHGLNKGLDTAFVRPAAKASHNLPRLM
mgnify:CR=1 FL=1